MAYRSFLPTSSCKLCNCAYILYVHESLVPFPHGAGHVTPVQITSSRTERQRGTKMKARREVSESHRRQQDVKVWPETRRRSGESPLYSSRGGTCCSGCFIYLNPPLKKNLELIPHVNSLPSAQTSNRQASTLTTCLQRSPLTAGAKRFRVGQVKPLPGLSFSLLPAILLKNVWGEKCIAGPRLCCRQRLCVCDGHYLILP